MQRIVSVWLPLWPIERMQRADRRANGGPSHSVEQRRAEQWRAEQVQPFALVESGVHGLTLAAVNEPARRQGLWPGQALTDARAAVPGLATRPAEREPDRQALHALALWCGRYGRRRNCHGNAASEDGLEPASLEPDSLWIDVTGVAHLFGGEAHLLDHLAGGLARSGLTARIGIADTFGAAFAIARFAATRSQAAAQSSTSPPAQSLAQSLAQSPWSIIPAGDTRAALSSLPVDALRLPADCVVLLKRLGLRRIGQLYDLPREALAQRFRVGARTTRRTNQTRRARETVRLAGTVLARLDQALGRAHEPLVPLEEPPAFSVRQAFIEPLISAEGVATSTAMLAGELCCLLDAGGKGGLRFALGLYRADGTFAHARIGVSRPCRDPAHLIGLLAGKLDLLDAGFGIDVMTLAATEVEMLEGRQTALPSPGMAAIAADASPLIDRLSNRLGAPRVLRLVAGDSHVPERAGQRRPALSAAGPASSAQSPTGFVKARRPPFLLPVPEPIVVTAEVPDGPPLRFTWRRLSRRVMRAEGPERIEPEWWRHIGRARGRSPHGLSPPDRDHAGSDRARDYYAIEDTGGARYWIYRAGLYGCDDARPPAWFLHGVFA